MPQMNSQCCARTGKPHIEEPQLFWIHIPRNSRLHPISDSVARPRVLDIREPIWRETEKGIAEWDKCARSTRRPEIYLANSWSRVSRGYALSLSARPTNDANLEIDSSRIFMIYVINFRLFLFPAWVNVIFHCYIFIWRTINGSLTH